jgi:hypothetical protein
MQIAALAPSPECLLPGQHFNQMKDILLEHWILAAIAVTFPASLPSAWVGRPLEPAALVGQYQIGEGNSAYPFIRLTLIRDGSFLIISNLGHKVKVRGNWRLDKGQVILCLNGGYVAMKDVRVFGWLLQVRSRGAFLDLVPNDTIAAYNRDPSNIGACYRRLDL